MTVDILRILESGKVRRWHTNHQLSTTLQSDADHTWGVIAIADFLCKDLVDANFMRHAMYHDCGEIAIGDVSSIAKMRRADLTLILKEEENKAIKEMGIFLPGLKGEQSSLLKLCDLLEALYHILMYAPFTDEIYGIKLLIDKISSIMFDFGERVDRIYEKIDFTFNSLIRQRSVKNEYQEFIQITPF